MSHASKRGSTRFVGITNSTSATACAPLQNPAAEVHRTIWRFIEQQLQAVDFRDRTVLDIGCWDGYWSFYAEHRGARHVLAADDLTQNWSDGSGLLLARELLGSAVEVNQRLPVYALATLGRRFDLILFFGVYYHLFDPFHALAQIRHCCHRDTLVLIEGNEALGLLPGAAVHDFHNYTSRFTPTREALHHLLRRLLLGGGCHAAGRGVARPPGLALARADGPAGVTRLAPRHGALLPPLYAARRVFLTCVPFEGVNDVHRNSPPFGLHVYDSRFHGPDRTKSEPVYVSCGSSPRET